MTAITAPFPTLPASDLARARRFYEDVLGAHVADEAAGGVTLELAGGRVWLYETPAAGTARHTQTAWFVDDIEADVAALEARGVTFDTFEAPGLEWDGVIARSDALRSAWFHDTEGNTLCIDQHV